MRRQNYSKIQFVFPITKPNKIPSSTNKILSMGLSSLLIISESLPFFDNIKSNGLLDTINKLIQNNEK